MTAKSISKYVYYEDVNEDEGVMSLAIFWDYEIKRLDKIMDNEAHCYHIGNKKQSLMWLQKIKEIVHWNVGDNIYIMLKQNCDGCFYAWFSKEKNKIGIADIIIEKSGYAVRLCFNNYTTDEDDENKICLTFYVPVDSYYNDMISKQKK